MELFVAQERHNNMDIQDIIEKIVGMDLLLAQDMFQDTWIRVVKKDEQYLAITADYRLDRINVATVNGIITKVEGIF